MGNTTIHWRPQAGREQGRWSTVASPGGSEGGRLGADPPQSQRGPASRITADRRGGCRVTVGTGGEEGPVQ